MHLWTHRRLSYPWRVASPQRSLRLTQRVQFNAARREPQLIGDTGAMPRKSRGFGGWPLTALDERDQKTQNF